MATFEKFDHVIVNLCTGFSDTYINVISIECKDNLIEIVMDDGIALYPIVNVRKVEAR